MVCLSLAGCTVWQPARTNGDAGVPAGSRLATNLPCDVQAILAANCQSCHGLWPAGGAPMSLVTYDDLIAPAKSDPTRSVAELCVARIQSATAPMPPTPPPMSSADIATLQNWVAAGMPMGDCVAGPDPLGAMPQCTSGQTWNGGGDGSSRMNPGEACISCHRNSGGEAPFFTIAGTVFPTGHEPDLCYGTNAVQVVITDAAGRTLTLTPNSAGNFSTRTSLTLPYNAKVVANGRTRAMSASQSSGDCNDCHTQLGANGAPGRITAP